MAKTPLGKTKKVQGTIAIPEFFLESLSAPHRIVSDH
jgi:hypothetical protein